MSRKYDSILLFGPPGSGKGTQGLLLKAIPGYFHMSTGDIFRGLDPTSDLGKQFISYSSKGELVPDELTVKIWAAAAQAHTTLGNFKTQSQLLVLDGIPRTANQAKLMDEYIQVLAIINLMAEDKEAMIERMKRRAIKEKRMDDADEKVIRRRWDVYEKETMPTLAYYPTELVHNVNAVGSPTRVLSEILKALAPIQDQRFSGVL